MKKLSLVLAVVLLAVPAWATVKVTATHLGEGVVSIDYEIVGQEPNLVRAFALDIVATDANIIEINNFTPGDDNGGYGVYPASFDAYIQVDGDGNVVTWDVAGYTPLADPCDHPGTQQGLGTNGVTVEMGSLYPEGGNAPGTFGQLCTVKVDGDCEVCISLNEARGEVVMENALPPDGGTDLSEACATVTLITDCFDSGHPDYDEWVAVGKPECWCYKYQCYGDADGKRNGGILGNSRVRIPDLVILIKGWMEPEDDITDPLFKEFICADFDRTRNGGILGNSRVRIEDLQILIASWMDDNKLPIPLENPQCGGDIDLGWE